ncbi:hypothetical protein Ait01nite_038770 [Actinoplanes italicus]|uniref:DUF732 domain-containing protein n=1 Tax=Actinoplanes italicus TaxID=113567 RepID=A0A2T0K2X5_9ACTN|nr:DUF732 domain-containing protein [Actinoplanes italicus]PRX17172.1 hypothetical protein CLV67_117229 [Actinoplanes italicus]GIE30832.1 hypothetical protein Ait01nite_038770 [Actinoplanes italicus]
MRRLALVATGVAVTMMAGCATAPPVPQWKDPGPAPASPGVTAAAAAVTPSPDAPTPKKGPQAPKRESEAPKRELEPPSDERFLAAVRATLPEVAMDLRNEEITEMGGQACESLAIGTTRRSAAAELAEYGLPEAEARKLVSLARSTLCRT